MYDIAVFLDVTTTNKSFSLTSPVKIKKSSQLSNSLNCKAEIIKQEKDLISIEIKKGENVIIEEKKQDELEDKCIFISSNKMGKGNDELGEILMKGFIYTLTESKPYPKSILLVNSGVKLSTENYDTVGNLKILEEAVKQSGYTLSEERKIDLGKTLFNMDDTITNRNYYSKQYKKKRRFNEFCS